MIYGNEPDDTLTDTLSFSNPTQIKKINICVMILWTCFTRTSKYRTTSIYVSRTYCTFTFSVSPPDVTSGLN